MTTARFSFVAAWRRFLASPHASLVLHSKDMHHELELLTKELRQVNLQQFIKQTGTKVTVLPAEPSEEEGSNSSQSKGNITFVFSTNGWIK